MTVGDNKSEIITLPGIGTYDYRPPVGETWLVTFITWQDGLIDTYITDGVSQMQLTSVNFPSTGRIFINNDQYILVDNTVAAARSVFISAVQFG